jgi:hypothetical protein
LVQQTGRVVIGHGSDTCYSYNSSKIEKSVASFAPMCLEHAHIIMFLVAFVFSFIEWYA